uniref:Copper transport protein ATOX1 n=1 Tax=Cyanoderma ruficeps TaxID=181631 RepID=A0A8C3NTK3_9PASS
SVAWKRAEHPFWSSARTSHHPNAPHRLFLHPPWHPRLRRPRPRRGAGPGPPLPPLRSAPRPQPRSGIRECCFAMPKHEFFVDMTCEGCSNAVTRVLQKLGGVSFDIDLPNKKVCIDSEHTVDTLLETLKKTGKNTSYLGEKSA